MNEGTVRMNAAGMYDLVITRDGQPVEEIRNLALHIAAGKLEELLYMKEVKT